MRFDGHHDEQADIAWPRFEEYDAAIVIAEGTDFWLRELDPTDRRVVGLEYWHASQRLPSDLLRMLAAPQIGAAR